MKPLRNQNRPTLPLQNLLRYKTMFYKGFIERIGRFRYALQNPLAARPRLAIKTYELGYIF